MMIRNVFMALMCTMGAYVYSMVEIRSDNISVIEVEEILELINKGDQMVFVDARENREFHEGHLPGAIRLTLREIDEDAKSAFDNADLVVVYCMKDFRGFEVAKGLQSLGVTNTAIMYPHGLNGWKMLGLPVVGESVTSEKQGLIALRACASDLGSCSGGFD